MEQLIETAIYKKEEIGMFDLALKIMWVEHSNMFEIEKADAISKLIQSTIK